MSHTKEQIDSLKSGYYGHVYDKGDFGKATLYEAQTTDPHDNDGWECADWYLMTDYGEALHLANCDGYNGVDMQVDAEEIAEFLATSDQLDGADAEELTDEIIESITSYNITGELMAEALRETMEEADEDYDGECLIWVTYNYYQGTINAPNDGLLTLTGADADNYHPSIENDAPAVFDSYADAEAWIDEATDCPIYLSHGEAGAPSYTIVKA